MAHEVFNVFTVLPHGVGAKTVNKNETWFAWFVQFGYPAMHGGSFTEVSGDGAEAGGGEELAVEPVPGSSEATHISLPFDFHLPSSHPRYKVQERSQNHFHGH